jgi:uncharacterized protein YacL
MGILILRLLIALLAGAAGYAFPPFGLEPRLAAGVGLALAGLVILLEIRIRRSPFKVVWSSMVGTFLGVALGWILGAAGASLADDAATDRFLRIAFLLILPYLGFRIGNRKPEWLDPAFLLRFFKERSVGRSSKILDTSVIIDGRIADLCDTGFIEGPLVVPQFVLKELQLVADSADGLKRQRGRRGLDMLNHLQKSKAVSVIITEQDFPEVKDVDSKLIELAKHMDGKIVTNDINLSKVARLHGLAVLNANELANALKPVVLPGETMRVYLIKEGKERDQGVAYLDDGTMVVVDEARRWIGQTVDVTVTSVLQTTVGKMIFARCYEDR